MKNVITQILLTIASMGVGIATDLTTKFVYDEVWERVYDDEKSNIITTILVSSISGLAAGAAVCIVLTKALCWVIRFAKKARG